MTTATTLSFTDLYAILPHRYPMLMLDHVSALEPGVAITAHKCVTGAEPCYQFVTAPATRGEVAYPASLILESFGQAGAVLWVTSRPPPRTPELLLLASVRDCYFDADVFPGDTMVHRVVIDTIGDNTVVFSGAVWVGARRVARIGWLLMVVRPDTSTDIPR